MGLQLTETLHGILPIAPTEDFHKENIQNLNKNLVGFGEFGFGSKILNGQRKQFILIVFLYLLENETIFSLIIKILLKNA